jgi:YgiT-type zinc finger domain-containing protein
MKPVRLPPKSERKALSSACARCCGPVEQKVVTITYPGADRDVRIVRGVPAGVCSQCGEQYLSFEVVSQLEKLFDLPPSRSEEVPVWNFPESA